MEVVILILVIAGALSIVVSGVWVAIALISAISAPRIKPAFGRSITQCQANEPAKGRSDQTRLRRDGQNK